MKQALSVLVLLFAGISAAVAGPPLLLREPSLSTSRIAFLHGGDLWIVDRAGGRAHPIVTAVRSTHGPVFSPDGSKIAYTGDYDGNEDVYVVPATGGQPQRLTWHPGPDVAVGWTPDGTRVLFRSRRSSATDPNRLFTVSLDGGPPAELPLDKAETGSYSPDATRLAYVPGFQWQPEWQQYHGGQTTAVWIARLSDSSVTRVPSEGSNDRNPMWVGTKVHFLSDRNGPRTLFAYDTESGDVSQVLKNDGFAIDTASAGPGAIVYSQMGSLHLYDLASGDTAPVAVEVAGDLPQVRARFENVAKQIEHASISPTGVRAVFEAHGEILTVPAEKGDVRNITRTPGVEERDPAWSPDGKRIAYFSDASGEYALHIESQDGLGEPRVIGLGEPPSFFYRPVWSPDGNKIAYSDKRLNLWYVDLDRPTPVKVDTDRFDTPLHEFDVAWSPDGKWLTYTKQLPNYLHGVFVYSLGSATASRVTDGMSDALYPGFDRSGKYLVFTASTNTGLTIGWLDMTSDARPVTRSVYVAVLRSDLPSPLAPESDEEKAPEKDSGKKSEAVPDVRIDLDGILQRTIATPIPAANYVGLAAGKEGEIFLLEAPVVELGRRQGPPAVAVQKFTLKDRKTTRLVDGITAFALSHDGEKMLIRRGESWTIAKTEAPLGGAPGDAGHTLDLSGMEVRVDPRAEWAQMYREVWRIERDFFYDPHYHGYDIRAAEQEFRAFLPGIASREELTFLFEHMLAYLNVGHTFVRGGHEPEVEPIDVGLLGADYTVDRDRYRFAKIYSGENWNPELHAPLTQPGVDVAVGEYLLAVNGQEIRGSDNLYRFFQETAGKQTVLRVSGKPDGSDARSVTVVPVPAETALRHLDWVEGNRRKVDELSHGKLAYVYLPDTGGGGYANFNRYFFSQVDKEGAVIDERFNHGGQLADYIIDYLRRPLMSFVRTREGETYAEPVMAIFGPKAMIINQFSGSGGDAMPWYFKRMGIGPLVGERTWGGLVGIGNYPTLMDGGRVTAPRWAIYGTHGAWEIENHGVAPDVEVWQDPKLVREGHDPQLERTVEILMKELREHPRPTYPIPAYPDYHPVLPPVPQEGNGR